MTNPIADIERRLAAVKYPPRPDDYKPEPARSASRVIVGSLFSGIGGLDLGLERAGMTVDWQCEKDPDANRVLERWWPFTDRYSDVKEMDSAVPRVDVLCGGFPCTDLSVAGNRAGLAGEQSRLFFEFVRLAGALAPRWILVENVPGLLSSNDGRDMGTVLGTLADLGYGLAWRVLDAQYFGVAQRRRRVFIVGHLGDPARAAAVLFEPESCDGHPAPSREPGTRAASTLTASAGSGGRGHRIGAEDAVGGHLVPVLSRTIMSNDRYDGDTKTFVPVSFAENQRAEVIESLTAAQLSAGGGKPGMAVRRLTPTECERLQGFFDGWTDQLSDSARYRVLGNAVCVPVAEWIGRRMREAA